MFEIRQAVRALRRRPAYVIAAIATLALVVGVNAALFAAINSTLFRPIPLKSGERTVALYLMPPGLSDPKERNPLHAIDLVRFRERSRTLTRIAGFTQTDRVLGSSGDPVVVSTIAANAEMLRLAVEGPIIGRVFTDDEEARHERLIVLSYGAWLQRFGGDRTIAGRTVQLDGDPYTVIGVMPRSFPPQFLDAELWTPLGVVASAPTNEGRTYIPTIAQLADGATLAHANAEVRSIVADLGRELPRTHQGWTGGAIGYRDWQFGGFRSALMVLFLAVSVLLLIAAANIASLTLAHVTAREGELALRRAIGATRWDIARQILLEVALLNTAGALCALAVGSWLVPALLAIAPATTRGLGDVTLDWRVALYAMACAAVASIAAGLVPAFHASDTAATLHAATLRTSGSRRRRRARAALLMAQTALCVALLVSGGLLVRALVRTSRVAVGYDPANVLTAQLQLPPSRYANGPERVAAMQLVIERISAIPGVISAGATMNRFKPGFAYQTQVQIEHQPTPDGSAHTVQFRRVSASYFSTMRIRQRSGRVFGPGDSLSTPAVAVISESFARRYWPGQDPIGRRVQRGPGMMTVIGVVDDVSDVDRGQVSEPTIYAAWSQTANVAFPMGLVLRTAGDPTDFARPLRQAISAIDPTLAVDRIQPLETFLFDSVAPQRFRATLMSVLGVVGLLLGAIGTAGVTARAVAERMPEFGVRLALGCDAGALWRTAVLHQLRIVAVGAACGLGLAIAAGRALGSILPETAGIDPVVLLGSVALLTGTAILAAAIPASRVFRVSPLTVLRSS
jgi:putative ABC transport system permease protein